MTSEITKKCPECGSSDLEVIRSPQHIFSYKEFCNQCGWHEK